jgi:hypothetical protein
MWFEMGMKKKEIVVHGRIVDKIHIKNHLKSFASPEFSDIVTLK